MNLEQVKLRREAINRRIEQLEVMRAEAASDRGWYQSAFVARAARNRNWDLMARVSDPQELAKRMERVLRVERVQELQQLAADLPANLGSRSLEPHPVRIAMIADEFLYNSLRDTAHVTYLRRDNFRDVAQESDLLIIASTWRGLDSEWLGTTSSTGLVRTQVIPAFRDAGVPVAFYSKEDPPNYDVFLPIAQEVDYIFTSAEEKIADYRRDCPEAKGISALTFGVNPMVHNPVGSRRHRRGEVLFAGSWIDHKYAQRKRAARKIFNGVLQAEKDLLILDRNSTLGDAKHLYPMEYLEHVGPGVPHADLMRIQRMMDVQINLNSVVNSATMFANRAVELQAMGAAVISNYNRALNNLFPNILIADSSFETRAMLESLRGDELYRLQSQGVHRAFYEHTAHQRMAELLEVVGLTTVPTHGRVLMVANEVTPAVEQIVAEQSIEVDVLSTEQLRTARAAGQLEHTVVLPVRDDYQYHHDYARSQVSVFAFADVDFVAKNGWEAAGEVLSKDDHEPISHADDPYRSALWQASDVTDRWLETGSIDGSGYGADPFGVDVQPEAVHATTADSGERVEPELTVVVPVYNNGRHLEDKCFRSLQRSSIFDRMEILLIDDGSTDGITPLVIKDLARRFPQVRTHFNPKGGSGSASRPRNQGLELASAPYITYLDPDNEAVNDGFARLLEMVKSSNLDFAIGDMLKFSYTGLYINNTKILEKVLIPDEESGGQLVPHDAIVGIDFQPMSIQALVANTEWLRSTGIEQPVGALGQDSLAFQEMLHAARRIDTIRKPIHVYYGAVANSMVNTVTPGFFRKYLPLEAARMRWLQENDLVDVYRERRARRFFNGWLLHKFNNFVSDDNRAEALPLLRELGAVYGIDLEPVDPQDPDGALRIIESETEIEQTGPGDPGDTEATVESENVTQDALTDGLQAPSERLDGEGQEEAVEGVSSTAPSVPLAQFWAGETDAPRTLILLETLLGPDGDPSDTSGERLSRFELTLASLNAVRVPPHVEVVVTVHAPEADAETRRALESVLEKLRGPRQSGLHFQIVGHEAAMAADRTADFRNRDDMFRDAHESLEVSAYKHVVRMDVGDEDLLLPWHLETVLNAVDTALAESPDSQAVAVDLPRSYVAVVREDTVELQDVEIRGRQPGTGILAARDPEADVIQVLSSGEASGPLLRRAQPADSIRPGHVFLRREGEPAGSEKDLEIVRTFATYQVGAPGEILGFIAEPKSCAASKDTRVDSVTADQGEEWDVR